MGDPAASRTGVDATPAAPEKDSSPSSQRALDRIVAKAGVPDLVNVLADRLSGGDLTTLLLEVLRQRAGAVSPARLLQQYERDRFVRPAGTHPDDLRRCHELVARALPADVELVELAPLAPLGAHSVVGTVNQHKVVSTVRGTEVAADPTNTLALEAATRRKSTLASDARRAELVRLGAFQRVVRAQRFGGDGRFAHFAIFGLVTAGRNTGSHEFEAEAAAEHCRFHVDCLHRAGADSVKVHLSDFTGRFGRLTDTVRRALADRPDTVVISDPDRTSGRGYYSGFCFKVHALRGDDRYEVSDGGLVDWTQQLLQNRKERLFISGIGIERLLLLG